MRLPNSKTVVDRIHHLLLLESLIIRTHDEEERIIYIKVKEKEKHTPLINIPLKKGTTTFWQN